MRSLLFVPGDQPDKMEKALASGADALILDLEDSVAADRKHDARRMVGTFVASARDMPMRLFVRINDLGSGFAEADLEAVMPSRPGGIVLPKAVGPDDVMALAMQLRVQEAESGLPDGATGILAIVTETARAVLAVGRFDRPVPRLSGLTWGAEDLSAAVGALSARDGAGRYTDLFRFARTQALLAASACETAAIDTVHPAFRDLDGLARECAEAARDGFTGKLAIHPAQVPVINAAFTPSPEQVEHARRIVDAFAATPGAGVLAIGGQMVDRPHLKLAERILARAAQRTQ